MRAPSIFNLRPVIYPVSQTTFHMLVANGLIEAIRPHSHAFCESYEHPELPCCLREVRSQTGGEEAYIFQQLYNSASELYCSIRVITSSLLIIPATSHLYEDTSSEDKQL